MFSLLSLPFELLFVLIALIVLGFVFKGQSWRPSFTLAGKRFTISIGVPQVAFSVVTVEDPLTAAAKALASVEQAPPAPPTAK